MWLKQESVDSLDSWTGKRANEALAAVNFQEISPMWKMGHCQRAEIVPWLLIIWGFRKIGLAL